MSLGTATEIVCNKKYIFDIWIELVYSSVAEGLIPNSFTPQLFLVKTGDV
jgi:hypothetical protein